MLQEYPITDLKPGMFVDEVIEQSGQLKVKSKGMVRTEKAIASLAGQGVLKVIVDLSKSKIDTPVVSKQVSENATTSANAATKTTSFEQEISHASSLYQEAKDLQKQALNNMKEGKPINTEAMKQLADGFIDSVFRNQDALACMTRMRNKDEYLMEHSINVSIIMTIFAKHMKMDKDIIHQLATGALLHDLGKIGVPDLVLNKPGKLTDAEMEKMKSHVTLGYNVLQKSGDLSPISIEMVGDHHERLDGSGYPNNKTDEDLSIYSKMIAIVDTYDAITATRCYQNSRTAVTAFKILRSESGTGFDESLVNEFIQCMGIHPVGTLVKMKNNKLGLVVKSNPINPISPVVHIFYSLGNKSYIEPKIIDLSQPSITDEIERCVKPEDFKIDMLKFFREILINN